MGGGHHEAPYKVPDWQRYKIEMAPELLKVQKELEAKGLKNPWLRNHIWRYERKYFPKYPLTKAVFRGLPIGLVVALTLFGIEKKMGGSEEHHHEGEH